MQVTSIKNVIARIIRNTGIQDGSSIQNMLEWVPEALGIMQIGYRGEQPLYCTLTIEDHTAKLPKDLKVLNAVQYGSSRLRESGNSIDFRNVALSVQETENIIFKAAQVINKGEILPIEDSTGIAIKQFTLTQISKIPAAVGEFYKLMPGYIQTSFETGEITVYFTKIPTDDDGYVLVPDNESLKEALYWFVRARLIGRGYDDAVFSYKDCNDMWEKYSIKAASEISTPSPETMHRIGLLTNRLIFPANFYNDFDTIQEEKPFSTGRKQ